MPVYSLRPTCTSSYLFPSVRSLAWVHLRGGSWFQTLLFHSTPFLVPFIYITFKFPQKPYKGDANCSCFTDETARAHQYSGSSEVEGLSQDVSTELWDSSAGACPTVAFRAPHPQDSSCTVCSVLTQGALSYHLLAFSQLSV